MDKRLCVLIRRAPYGLTHAAEALRHVDGALANGWTVDLLLADDGVHLARRAAAPAAAGAWPDLVEILAKLIRAADPTVLRVVAGRAALADRGIATADLVEGIQAVADEDVAARLAAAPVMAY